MLLATLFTYTWGGFCHIADKCLENIFISKPAETSCHLSLKQYKQNSPFYWENQRNELLLKTLKKKKKTTKPETTNPETGPFIYLAEMHVQFFGIDSVPNLVHWTCFGNRSSVKFGHGPSWEVRLREKEGHCRFFLFFLTLGCVL